MSSASAWPEGFVWGVASSSLGTEGAAPASDWARWERDGRAPPSGEGNGFLTRHREDHALFADLGLNAHRLVLDWARLEPSAGHHDPAVVEHYRAVLSGALEAGVAPWVCLHHVSLPGWFAEDEHGFRHPDRGRYLFSRHVNWMAETFGDLAAAWVPGHGPAAWALASHFTGTLPPGRTSNDDFHTVLGAVLAAQRDAARLLRGTGAPVVAWHTVSPLRAVGDDAEAAIWTTRIDEVLWRSWTTPDWAASFDAIAVATNGGLSVDGAGALGPWATDDHLAYCLHRTAEMLPDTPLYAATGVGHPDDAEREARLPGLVAQVAEALRDGIDVRGLFWWTGVDGYETATAHALPWGLVDRDRNPKPSAAKLALTTRQAPGRGD
jgi:beta-glucosidase